MDYRIDWKGSPNHSDGRNGHDPLAIVNHIMQSSIESATGWFGNLKAEVSSHFGVARDGRIWQYVALENAAWANGPVANPDTSLGWLHDAILAKVNPNDLTVSIEHEGYTGKPFTPEQYQATLWLHKYLIKKLGIKIDREHLVGHYQIDGNSRKNCPGSAFPWKMLMADLALWQAGSDKYLIGAGARSELNAYALTPKSDELYYEGDAGKVSVVETNDPLILVISILDINGIGWVSRAKRVIKGAVADRPDGYNPNPDGLPLAPGGGAISAIEAANLMALSGEQYFKREAGGEVSLVYVNIPGIQVFSEATPANGGDWVTLVLQDLP